MFLSDFSIRRPVATLVLIITLMFLGLLALKKLRVNQIPDVQQPIIAVEIAYPGASPEAVEREILNRLEKTLQSVPGVNKIESAALDSSAEFVIFFNYSKNMVEASEEVRNSISSVRYKMPTEMREPVITRIDPSAEPLVQISFASTSQSHSEISRIAEDKLADRFRAIPGVSLVEVSGALKRELSVLLRTQKMHEFNVSLGEVVAALRDQNATAPVGKIKSTMDEKSIRLVGRIENPREFEQVVVKRNGSDVVRLGQIATIQDGFADLNRYSLRNGNPNVGIFITRARDASGVAVAKRVLQEIDKMNQEFVPGTKLEVTRNGGEEAQNSLDNVTRSLIDGAILTVLVVFIFLNSWRSTLITALSLPTSAIAAFIAIWLCGFTLNFMTLLGLSLAIGVLIDDAIVVRENIVRHLNMGKDRKRAAAEGTAEIGMAVAATTFSIISVFIPVAFMSGESGEWFRPFALTVAASVLVSLAISFTLDPMLSAYWGDPPGYHEQKKTGLGGLLDRFNHWFDSLSHGYQKVIAWALHHRILMAIIAVACFAGAIVLQIKTGGSSFLPKSDYGQMLIEVRTPSSASVQYARAKVESAAAMARSIPETKATSSVIFVGGGRVYVDIGKSTTGRRSIQVVAAELRERVKGLVGAEYVVLDDLNNGARKPVQIEFYGPDARKLNEIADQFMLDLKKVKGAADVGLSELEPKDELKIELKRGLANSLGVSANDAAQALRVAFAGVEVGDWIDPSGETRDVAVRLHPQDRVSLENIERLPISIGQGNSIPLSQIADISIGKGPAKIAHKNGKRTISVSANAEGRSPGEITQDAVALAKTIKFPPGFGVELGGDSQTQNEVFSEMGIALVMGIALMYLILVMQFDSFTAPIPVMLSLPLSLIGVVIALKLTGHTLNLMSFIGIIMLAGLVAKNAILLLDCARREEERGMEREEALMYAGRMRLRPILMTTFALIAGMMPVAIGAGEGGEFYAPMAVAIIGGTITSTLLTLLVIPSFYDSIEKSRDGAIAKYKMRAMRRNPFLAFMQTFVEAILTLLMLRFCYRMVLWMFGRRQTA
ncbi:efflux RND transporter permease subunit [Massilia sp. W12]|uniref:efflux RND transporter permease subunit n=1 Tax=Massilia sp. W12 TaxID=3126507 RepID=UPI0030D06451